MYECMVIQPMSGPLIQFEASISNKVIKKKLPKRNILPNLCRFKCLLVTINLDYHLCSNTLRYLAAGARDEEIQGGQKNNSCELKLEYRSTQKPWVHARWEALEVQSPSHPHFLHNFMHWSTVRLPYLLERAMMR